MSILHKWEVGQIIQFKPYPNILYKISRKVLNYYGEKEIVCHRLDKEECHVITDDRNMELVRDNKQKRL